MQNQEGNAVDADTVTLTSIQTSEIDEWENFKDDDIMLQQSAIQAEEAEKIPFVGDKARELLSLEKIKHFCR